MNFDELCQRTRELAVSGMSLDDILFEDEIGDVYCALSTEGVLDTDKLEAEFVEGRREFRIANGWICLWTNAYETYDAFDTESIDEFEYDRKVVRRVLVNPRHEDFQHARYASGASVWGEDPREIAKRVQERIAKDKAQDEERRRIREEGLAWIRSMSDDDLDSAIDDLGFDGIYERGLVWNDIRAEQERREEEKAAKERAAEWERCRSAFVDGCTIVDPGRGIPTITNREITIGPSDAAVYRNVRVVPHWSAKDSVEDAIVEDERHAHVGSLWRVAKLLELGLLRIARSDECLPSAAVMDRLRPTRLDHIVRVECEGRVVWGMRERCSYTSIVVVDENGKLVRKRSIKEIAEKVVREKAGWR